MTTKFTHPDWIATAFDGPTCRSQVTRYSRTLLALDMHIHRLPSGLWQAQAAGTFSVPLLDREEAIACAELMATRMMQRDLEALALIVSHADRVRAICTASSHAVEDTARRRREARELGVARATFRAA